MYNPYGKRIIDLLLVILSLPVSLPIAVLCVLAIKIAEPREPVLFVQDRIGKGGKIIKIFKFRTMKTNGDKALEEYLSKHPEEIEHYRIYHKYKNDPRITIVGRLLRKTSLDELPQLWNVLIGNMSLVGFRPYLLSEKEKMEDKYESIIKNFPGVTGPWQVKGRHNTPFEDRLQIEANYTPSLIFDIKIIIKTIFSFFTGK